MPDCRVAICASAYDGLKSPLVAGLLNLGLALGWRKETKYLPILVPRLHGATCLNAAIILARDAIAAADVREPLTHILWFDRDVMLTGRQAFQLLDAVDPWHPAVFALGRDQKHPELPNLWSPGGPSVATRRMEDWPSNALVQVRSAGLAAAAFDGELFDSLKPPWFRHDASQADGDVCFQFHAQSIPVYCHTGVTPRQMGAPPTYGAWK